MEKNEHTNQCTDCKTLADRLDQLEAEVSSIPQVIMRRTDEKRAAEIAACTRLARSERDERNRRLAEVDVGEFFGRLNNNALATKIIVEAPDEETRQKWLDMVPDAVKDSVRLAMEGPYCYVALRTTHENNWVHQRIEINDLMRDALVRMGLGDDVDDDYYYPPRLAHGGTYVMRQDALDIARKLVPALQRAIESGTLYVVPQSDEENEQLTLRTWRQERARRQPYAFIGGAL